MKSDKAFTKALENNTNTTIYQETSERRPHGQCSEVPWSHLCLFHKPVAVTLIRPIGFYDGESGLLRPEL